MHNPHTTINDAIALRERLAEEIEHLCGEFCGAIDGIALMTTYDHEDYLTVSAAIRVFTPEKLSTSSLEKELISLVYRYEETTRLSVTRIDYDTEDGTVSVAVSLTALEAADPQPIRSPRPSLDHGTAEEPYMTSEQFYESQQKAGILLCPFTSNLETFLEHGTAKGTLDDELHDAALELRANECPGLARAVEEARTALKEKGGLAS